MAEVIVAQDRITAQVSESSETPTTKLTITAAELTTAGFAANDEVAILVLVNVETSDSSTHVRTRLTYDGTPLGPESGRTQHDLGAASRQRTFMWMEWVDLGATIGDIDLDLQSINAGLNVFINKSELIVFRLADLGTEGVDWFRNKSTTVVAHTDTYSATSRASITWTPAVAEDWIVLGSLAARIRNKDINHEGRFTLDSTPIAGDWTEEGESTNERKKWLWFDRIPLLSTVSHTVAIQTRDDSAAGTQNDHTQSNLLIFRADQFPNLFVTEPGNVLLPSATDTQVATITDSISGAQNAILIGQGNGNFDAVNDQGFMWIRKDGSTVIDPVVDSASGLAAIHLYDISDEPLMSVLAFNALASGAADLDLFAHQTEASSRTLIDVKFLVWGLSLDVTEIIDDDVGVTDEVTTAKDAAQEITDDLGVTDEILAAKDVPRTIDEAVGITDEVTAVKSSAVEIDESVGIADDITAAKDATAEISDSVGVTDDTAAAKEAARQIDEAVGVIDDTSRVHSAVREITELVDVMDDTMKDEDNAESNIDPVGVSDEVTRVLDSVREVTDDAGITDEVLAAKTISVVITDGVGIGDQTETAKAVVVEIVEAVGVADPVVRQIDWVRTITDAIGIDDPVLRVATFDRTIIEALGVVDDISGFLPNRIARAPWRELVDEPAERDYRESPGVDIGEVI